MNKLVDFFRRLKERHTFNAANCRAKIRTANESKVDAKISEITGRIKFVSNYPKDETTVIFRMYEDTDYEKIARHFLDLGFIVLLKEIQELEETFMLISWKQ